MKIPKAKKEINLGTYICYKEEDTHPCIMRYDDKSLNVLLYDDKNFPLKTEEYNFYKKLCGEYERQEMTLEKIMESFLERN